MSVLRLQEGIHEDRYIVTGREGEYIISDAPGFVLTEYIAKLNREINYLKGRLAKYEAEYSDYGEEMMNGGR